MRGGRTSILLAARIERDGAKERTEWRGVLHVSREEQTVSLREDLQF